MKKLVKSVLITAAVAAAVAAYWYFRPGSEYSPREVISMINTEDRRVPYRTMEKIYPSRPIRHDSARTRFPRDERVIDISYEWDGKQRDLEDYAARRDLQGILVVEDGTIRMERYFGQAVADDRFTSWSVAKSVISTLIGIALKDGVIGSLDDKVSAYAPVYAGTDYGDTTIRHLLMMSSGIAFNENYEEPGSDIRNLFIRTFLFNRDVDNFVRGFERNREPGQDFDYISSNTQVLTAVLRGAYGEPLIDIFNRELAAPLGITGGTWLTDRQGPAGKELGYCCLQLTLRDYAKLGQLYIQDGVIGRERILPEGWAEFVSTPPQESHEPKENGWPGYGHHFWIMDEETGGFTMQGYDGQYVHMDPEQDVVIVLASANRRAWGDTPEYAALFRSVKDSLENGPDGGQRAAAE